MGENLTDIIDKYKDSLDLILGTTEQEIFTNFYEKVDKTIAQQWIESTFTKSTLKDDDKSKQLREQGNVYFKENKLDLALKNYNESLDLANHNSQTFCFALANRSAVFFARENYKCCIKDIEECFDQGYPDNLKYKIYIRLVNCYIKLFNYEKAKEIITILIDTDLNDALKEQIQLLENDLIEIENKTKIEIDEKISLPSFEPNINFPSASNLIKLNSAPLKGRHVIATSNIKSGDILFVEKSFSVVPISQTNTCYHCFTTTDSLIPCKNCFTKYCSQKCLKTSWESYHRFECTGSCSDVWERVGVNYLAVRMLVEGGGVGIDDVFGGKFDLDNFGSNKYEFVCSLITNINNMDSIDLFPHIISALIFTLYLQQKTNFFDHISGENAIVSPLIIGSVLLKHILQVISNATTIESVRNEFYDQFNSTEQISESGYQFSGVAMYPSVSMMNHSCDPNITNYFINDYIIVKAKIDISEGSEIFNSYGYDCRKQITINRKTELKKQHYFDCSCLGCTFPQMPEIFHEGLKCQSCSGLSLSKNDDIYECTDCKHVFNAKKYFLYIRKAETLFEKYERSKNLEFLKKCLKLREKTFYGESGDIKLWWLHTQKTLEMDQIILGENSLRSGLNLRLCLLILLRYLTTLNFKEKNVIDEILLLDLVGHATNMFEKMKNIFYLYYDCNKIDFFDINELLQDAIAIATYILRE